MLRARACRKKKKILFDNDTESLLTPGFWILPLYRELLNSARRNRPSAASERARGCTGLVKLICKENKEHVLTAVLHWTGALCENTKPKTSFVEPQGTTTPNHFSSKPFARHTNMNQPRRMAVFQSLSICYF